MKTTSYNAEKEIKIGILVALFTISIFTAIKVKDFQLKEATNTVENISNQILIDNNSIPSMPTLNARLIEEPIPDVESLTKNLEYKAADFVNAEMALENERLQSNNKKAIEAEPWMNIAQYKTADFVNAEMVLESERSLSNNNEVVEAEPWMNIAEYKTAEFVNAEMALESERLLNNNNVAVEAEPWMNIAQYKTADFVNAEMALESERFLNGNNEVVKSEPWMAIAEYTATKYVETEMALEIQNWMKNESFKTGYPIPKVETQTALSDSPIAIE